MFLSKNKKKAKYGRENSEPAIEIRSFAFGEVYILKGSNTMEPSEVNIDFYHKILVLDLMRL